jgi:hypothetical protein
MVGAESKKKKGEEDIYFLRGLSLSLSLIAAANLLFSLLIRHTYVNRHSRVRTVIEPVELSIKYLNLIRLIFFRTRSEFEFITELNNLFKLCSSIFERTQTYSRAIQLI